MAAFVLTMVCSLFLGGGAWLALGSRWHFSEDEQNNDALNFAAYFLATIPITFVIVLFGIGA